MRRDHRHNEDVPGQGAHRAPGDRDRAGWQGLLLIAVGWAGVAIAHATPGFFESYDGATAVFSTTGLGAVSLVAIGGGAAIAVNAALSPRRHVFCSRPAFLAAAMLFVVAVVSIAALIVGAPLDGVAAHGRPLETVTADLAWFAASLICVVGWGAASRLAWQARRDERNWDRFLF